MKQRKHHHRVQDEPQTITKAVTQIRLEAANAGKLAALDDLVQVYLVLCQQYVTLFCTEEAPDKFRATCFATPLSERWHRVAIQQAAGIAQSWRSNLAHIPKQIAWNAAKRGRAATRVKSAYSSQECSICHHADRANRPNQQTFCCVVCGYSTHADLNAALNIEHRWGDDELRACKDRKAVKALLMQRHQIWKQQNGWP